MNMNALEKAAEKFFEMCAMHPEICPHDYNLYTSTKNKDGSCVERYRCSMCGSEYANIQRKPD